MATAAERRRAARIRIAVQCTLQRAKGGPIRCETVDVGLGGMAVSSDRPFAADELVAFDVVAGAATIHGQARVLREEAYHVYALRFEVLQEEARAALARLVAHSG